MNLPNSLTVSRFLVLPIYVFCFFAISKSSALIIILLAGVTDVLDGYLARKLQQTTKLGVVLDPLADKALIITVSITLIADQSVHWFVGIIVILRELIMILFAIVGRLRGWAMIAANQAGKLTTIFYYILFTVILLDIYEGKYADIVLLLPFIVSLVASGYYGRLLALQAKRHTRGT